MFAGGALILRDAALLRMRLRDGPGPPQRLAHAGPAAPPVITGLVPVIPLVWSAAPARIGMAGTGPAMAGEGMLCSLFVLDSSLKLGYIVV